GASAVLPGDLSDLTWPALGPSARALVRLDSGCDRDRPAVADLHRGCLGVLGCPRSVLAFIGLLPSEPEHRLARRALGACLGLDFLGTLHRSLRPASGSGGPNGDRGHAGAGADLVARMGPER